MYRYFAAIWDPHGPTGIASSGVLLAGHPDWSIAYEGPGALVIHTGIREGTRRHYVLDGSHGVVLGTLFEKDLRQARNGSSIAFGDAETCKVIDTAGTHLIANYWGAYVAILYDRSRHTHHVLREPTANLPCSHIRQGNLDLFFSHIADCVGFVPLSLSINRRYLVRWLIVNRLLERECGLEEIGDVLGGERISICRGRLTRALLWNPVELADAAGFEKVEDAARQLRWTVESTVNAWVRPYKRVAHKLSGGLDSSIVAACLSQADTRPDVSFLHLTVDVGFAEERLHLLGIDKAIADRQRALTGPGDERYFARLVAEKWKRRLVEKPRDLHMDLSRMWSVPLTASPTGYFTAIEADDAEIELATTLGVQACFSGQAGDSVMLATTQPFAAIDYAFLHPLGRLMWRHILAACKLTRQSFWTVMGATMRHGLLRRPYRSPIGLLQIPTLLRSDLLETLTDEDFASVWAKAASTLPPGKQNHIEGLSGSAYYDCLFHSQGYLDHIDPLNSQPIWELTLQIPTYTLLASGVSRGLVRRAFADALPAEIGRRQIKGTGAPFYQRLVRRNRDFLKEVLLDGRLVSEGFLDREKLNACLSADEPFMHVGALEILCYLAAEVWCQQWHQRSQQSLSATRAAARVAVV